MPRRASSRLHPGLIVGILVAVAALFFVGKSFFAKKPAGFGNIGKLSMEDYLQNGNSLRGNEYVVDGKVDGKLGWNKAGSHQVISLQVESPGGPEFIGIEIPPEFSQTNIEREQRYSFRVKFRDGGIAVASGINRL